MDQRLILSSGALAPAAMSTPSKEDEDKPIVADDGTLLYSDYTSSDSALDDPFLRNSLRTSFHQDLEGLMDDFDVVMLDFPSEMIEDQLVYRVKLPLHLPNGASEEILLDLWCFDDNNDSYNLGFRIFGEQINEDVKSFFQNRLKKEEGIHPNILQLLAEFYVHMERLYYPDRELFVRDFHYPVNNPLHFGHRAEAIAATIPPVENYEAKVMYPYQAVLEGELTVDADDVLLILKNLGNGWVCARRRSQTGLVPENYIQRVFPKT